MKAFNHILYPLLMLPLFALICGCSDNTAEHGTTPPPPEPDEEKIERWLKEGRKDLISQHYWNKCIKINSEMVADLGDIWLEEIRPKKQGSVWREAARKLRHLGQKGVDGKVAEHVNEVMREFENVAGIIEKEGRKAIWESAIHVALFVATKNNAFGDVGAVADAGNVTVGLGLSGVARAVKIAAEADVKNQANDLIRKEKAVIEYFRSEYDINLKAW